MSRFSRDSIFRLTYDHESTLCRYRAEGRLCSARKVLSPFWGWLTRWDSVKRAEMKGNKESADALQVGSAQHFDPGRVGGKVITDIES